MKDVGSGNREQNNRLKSRSKKGGTSPRGRPDSIRGRANRENNHVPESKGEEERVEVKKRPSIVISIQLD